MAKVLMLARTFPAYHPSAGSPTYFVEKFLKGCPAGTPGQTGSVWELLPLAGKVILDLDKWDELGPKYHTIRAGHRFKPGDFFSPRVWEGTPYCSPQIIIAPDTKVVKTWDFEMYLDWDDHVKCKINGDSRYPPKYVGEHDGLTEWDFINWFPKPFIGQIICWNPIVNY